MTHLQRIGAGAAMLAFLAQPSVAQDVIFVPTPPEVVQRMLEIAEVGPGDTVLDLGSGDGRIVISAVKDFGAERGIGVEIDPTRIAESNQNARAAGVANRVEFRQENLFDADFSEADVITMYLLQSINERLKPTLLAEARPGTRIVSHDFHMGDWAPEQVEKVGTKTIYRWTVPARVDGEWQVEVQYPKETRRYLLDVEQNVQHLQAVASTGQHVSAVRGGRVDGSQLSFAMDDGGSGELEFKGRIAGETIEGTVRDGNGTEVPWQAQRLD